MPPLLTVKNLKTWFRTDSGLVKAVDGISYYIAENEIVALVGESGCGKSVSQLSTLQLIPKPPGEIVDGKIFFDGMDLLQLKANGKKMRSIRGGKIAIIFQEPMTSLNPVLTISEQLTEMLEIHRNMSRRDAIKRAIELLKLTGISDADNRIHAYPHQFSGGMRQPVMIATALSCDPKILIADEPTTAVDVTTQAQLLELMKEMVDHFHSSLILVTHNLGIVARYAQRIYVMYAGRIVESGTTEEIFGNPSHPYTIGLLKSVPRLDRPPGEELIPIVGMPPNLIDMPPTCAFLPRCQYHNLQCKKEPWPELKCLKGGHYVSCYENLKE